MSNDHIRDKDLNKLIDFMQLLCSAGVERSYATQRGYDFALTLLHVRLAENTARDRDVSSLAELQVMGGAAHLLTMAVEEVKW